MRRSLVVGTAFLIWILFGSWGFLVHRTVNQLAVYELPKGLRTFFYINMDYVVKHSVRPDLRRNEDSTEDTKHFINLEAFGDSAAWKMPMSWGEAERLYSRDSLLKYGYVPYHIITTKNRLTSAFKNKNKDSILFYAADLAHYIGDAHVPLHTTLNYDGQLTNQKGLHSLWESMIPEIELDQYDLSSRHKVKYLERPEQSIWKAIRKAYILTKEVFLQEKETSKKFTDTSKYRFQIRRGKEVRSYSTEFAKAYSQKVGATINSQLISSANLIADFWYTSWVDAGKPDMGAISKSLTDEQKETMKKECKAFKENKLVTEKLLLSRKEISSTNP
ncbi:MAG: hypothetical protein H7122_17125 [Chitinophagaceae bacterium]|nr:hypothetical protein [Chitinophagaceae bacterium]